MNGDMGDYDLFDGPPTDQEPAGSEVSLAYRMRPRNLDEYIGQAHLVGPNGVLRQLIEQDTLPNIVLYGPPGIGKTSLARVISHMTKALFEPFNAVNEGVGRIREIAEAAEKARRVGRKTILFVDECHRLSRAQQDTLLPFCESGLLTLIAATTENPAFAITGALLSRCRVFRLEPLTNDDLRELVRRALEDPSRGLGEWNLTLEPEAERMIIGAAGGDARRVLNTLETAAWLVGKDGTITPEIANRALAARTRSYDRDEDKYQLLSWYQKSIRGSHPDAALIALAKMIEGGEDERVIFRRLMVIAAEDIGMADPNAMTVVASAFSAFEAVGAPEGHIPLAAATVYCATAPKSNRAYRAWKAALELVRSTPRIEVPMHLRNAPTWVHRKEGAGVGYKYPFDRPDHFSAQEYLPASLRHVRLYEPSEFGFERKVAERMAWWEERRKAHGGGR